MLATLLQAVKRAIDAAMAPPGVKFTCGDCDRNVHCGLPPDTNCVYRAMQIARGDRPRPLLRPWGY